MEYLALSVLGEFQPFLLTEITKLISSSDCSITECQMNPIGSEFAASFLLSGNWSTLAKLESQLPMLEAKYHLHCIAQRTKPADYPKSHVPYHVYVIAPDKQGVLHELNSFFTEQGIIIDNLDCESFAAKHTGVTMLSINMSISIPLALQISELREQFLLFCDRYNLDGLLEPDKY